MLKLETHSEDSAPHGSQATLAEVVQAYGMIPNVYGKMAGSPALVQGYWSLTKLLQTTTLSGEEQLVVALTVSAANRCAYCVGAHSAVNDAREVPGQVTDAIRDGVPIDDARLQALRSFTEAVVTEKGWVPEPAIQTFLAAGFQTENVLEVLLVVGLKTMSNYLNHMAGTELDDGFTSRQWSAVSATGS